MLPRPVLPGETVMITRRVTQRQFVLRPDPDVNQIYLYVLGLAAQRTGVDLIYAMTMSNHEHPVVHDRAGTRVEFYQYLHQLVARATNALRGPGVMGFGRFWRNDHHQFFGVQRFAWGYCVGSFIGIRAMWRIRDLPRP